MNGLIQTSLVSSGTKEEQDAYIKSFEILNDSENPDNPVLYVLFVNVARVTTW
jgi:hypothetical protein